MSCPHKHAHAASFIALLAVFVLLCGLLDWVMRWKL